jgi:hypothetical protein
MIFNQNRISLLKFDGFSVMGNVSVFLNNLIGCHVGRGCNQFEDEVSCKVVGQVSLGGHEDDDDCSRDPEDKPPAKEITQVTEN